MSNLYLWLKWLHIVSSAVLLGTGAGIAFFFARAQRTRDVRVIAAVARDVVLADLVFTAVAVVVQPVTGLLMMHLVGYLVSLPWIRTTLVLFTAVGCCWLPVLWLQLRMRDMAVAAAATGSALPPAYGRYYRWWFALGWPSFAGVLAMVWVMVVKRGF